MFEMIALGAQATTSSFAFCELKIFRAGIRAQLAFICKTILVWISDLNYTSMLGKRATSGVQFRSDIQKNVHGPRSCPI